MNIRDDIRDAILKSIDVRTQAAELHLERGTIDVGLRSQVTSGKHLDALADVVEADLIKAGLSDECIFKGPSSVEIPGWFRATKKWDILAFHEDRLVSAIEMKSIFGSYGNNINNRAEEAIGESTDAVFAIKNRLIDQTIPPILGYALIVKSDEKSRSICRDPSERHFSIDPEFYETSYIDRFRIMCKRLRRESLFGAVWFVVVDPIDRCVIEPDPDLTYEKFIAEITGRIKVFQS